MDGLVGGHVIETQGLVKRIDVAGGHVTAAGYDVSVPAFDFLGKLKERSNDGLHFRQ